MRIDPVHHNISFWALHWPWWRTRMRTAYGKLPNQVQTLLRPTADRLLLSDYCRADWHCQTDQTQSTTPLKAPQPQRPQLDLYWPSDRPPDPEPRIEIRVRTDARPRESGDYFDFFI